MSKHVPKTPEEQTALLAAGFIPADGCGGCCVCSRAIVPGQWIRLMPPAYVPPFPRPHNAAHRKCVLAVVAELSAKSGKRVSL